MGLLHQPGTFCPEIPATAEPLRPKHAWV
jgi:hypothetical protein